jgi:uncharacterized protein involved in oxidation of intracellular sulfur
VSSGRERGKENAVKILFILNDPPYGTERSYNGLRLAGSMVTKHESAEVDVFLMGDAVACAKSGQTTPNGYYNLERMLKPVLRRGRVLLCGSCMDARGLKEGEIVEGAKRSTLEELTQLSVAADKVIVF